MQNLPAKGRTYVVHTNQSRNQLSWTVESVPTPHSCHTRFSLCSPWTSATPHQPGTTNCLFSAIRIWTVPPMLTPARPLPSLCLITASSAWSPHWQGTSKQHQALTVHYRTLQLEDRGIHCWRVIDQPWDRHTKFEHIVCLLYHQ